MDAIKTTKCMKSIKEKAHEIGWVHSKHYDPIVCKQEWCEMAARESANYVLEVVESILEDKELDVEETCYKIYATIKQLKK